MQTINIVEKRIGTSSISDEDVKFVYSLDGCKIEYDKFRIKIFAPEGYYYSEFYKQENDALNIYTNKYFSVKGFDLRLIHTTEQTVKLNKSLKNGIDIDPVVSIASKSNTGFSIVFGIEVNNNDITDDLENMLDIKMTDIQIPNSLNIDPSFFNQKRVELAINEHKKNFHFYISSLCSRKHIATIDEHIDFFVSYSYYQIMHTLEINNLKGISFENLKICLTSIRNAHYNAMLDQLSINVKFSPDWTFYNNSKKALIYLVNTPNSNIRVANYFFQIMQLVKL